MSLIINRNRKYGYWWSVVLGGVLILAFYGKFIFNANEYVFSEGGDGIKNYYTFAWHINHDSSYTHFRGMNHPYGEHVVFTDNQPLISNIFRAVNLHFTYIGNYAIGINNLLLFAGLLAGILILYHILFSLTQNVRISVAAALVLGLLSPQIQRFNGHFALAYCFVIPLYIWWMYRFFNTPTWRTSRAMAIMLLLLMLVHVYYLVIVGSLLLAMWLMFIIRESPRINIFTAIPHLLLQIAAPLAIYFIWLKLTDNVVDRPTQPYGIVEYAAYWEGLLLPLGFDYFEPIKEALGVRKVSVETIAYAGFPTLLFVLWGIYIGARKLFRFRRREKNPFQKRTDKPYDQRFMTCLIWAVAIVFCYAAFVPYLFNIPSVSKYLGLLKQFRSLGRLLWVVYYGLTLFLFWYVYQKTKNKIQQSWIPWTVILVFAVEGIIYNVQMRDVIDNPYKEVSWAKPQKLSPKKYQAIIPLPFFHEGSENIGATPPNDKIVEQSFLLSLQTGIPLQAVKMSRTSLSQTLEQLEMGYEYTATPRLLRQGSNKPYLLLHYIKDSTTLPELKNMRAIAATDSFKLYRFSPKILEVLLIRRASEITVANTNRTDSTPHIFEGYENLPSEHLYKGEGALVKNASETITLADTACTFCNDSVTVSFWIYAKMEGLPQLKLLVHNEGVTRVHVPNHVKAFYDDWMLVEYTYRPKNGKLHLQLIKEGAKKGQQIFLDNFMARPAQQDVLKVTPDFVMKNNRYISQYNP